MKILTYKFTLICKMIFLFMCRAFPLLENIIILGALIIVSPKFAVNVFLNKIFSFFDAILLVSI